MALPRQVEAQLRELEKIEQQLAQEKNPQPADPQDPPSDPKPAEPQVNTDPKPVEPTPVETKPTPTEPVADEKWEQKYKTLKGMYDAEVPRLYADLRDLKAQVDSLRKAAETKPVEQAKTAPAKLVTDADVEAFGSDLIEVQRKVAREVAAEFREELDAMRAENAELRKQVGDTGSRVVEASFESRLHRMVPDFEQVNTDPKWIEWLEQIDPMLRGPRKAAAQNAFANGDVEGVAHYVKLFKESIAPAAAAEPASTTTEELNRQIQPSRNSAASTPVTSQKGRTYTSADITKMFQKAVTLSNRGQFDEAKKLEAEIDAAYMSGRVTG